MCIYCSVVRIQCHQLMRDRWMKIAGQSHKAEEANVVKCWGNLFSILYEMESDEEQPCKFCTVTPTMNTLLID
jgi:hypothetical protein